MSLGLYFFCLSSGNGGGCLLDKSAVLVSMGLPGPISGHSQKFSVAKTRDFQRKRGTLSKNFTNPGRFHKEASFLYLAHTGEQNASFPEFCKKNLSSQRIKLKAKLDQTRSSKRAYELLVGLYVV